MKHLKYLWYVLRHKWYVFIECCKEGHWYLGLIHDWSKFRPSEWLPYADHFFGKHAQEYRSRLEDPRFQFAWHLHKKRNKHHWQWWLSVNREKNIIVQEMLPKYCDEMIADWRGTSRARGKGDNTKEWYMKVKDRLILGPQTQKYVKAKIFN